jgi:ABC-type antimicrobial peptide transport system permease subunit
MGVRMPDTMTLTVRSAPVIKAAIVSMLTMLAGGLLPAIRAARLNPIDAMRHV